MATRISRVICSAATEAVSLRYSSQSQHTSIPLFSRQTRHSLKGFSTFSRHCATPSPTYVRKPVPTARPPPSTVNLNTITTTPPTRTAPIDDQPPIQDLTSGLSDEPLILDEGTKQVDWTRSFHGLSSEPFSKEAADILLAPIPFDDVECKPDGIIYLPEIKYRRILNKAFGPGGWGLAPRGETIVTGKSITREYALERTSYLWIRMDHELTTRLTDLYLSRVANKITSLQKAYLLRPRAVNRTR